MSCGSPWLVPTWSSAGNHILGYIGDGLHPLRSLRELVTWTIDELSDRMQETGYVEKEDE